MVAREEAALADNIFAANRLRGALHPAFDVVREMFLQEQLDQFGTLFIDFDDLRAHAIFTGVHNFDHALERLLREKIALEMQRLPDDQRTGAHDQHAAVTHVLDDARKAFSPSGQRTSACDRSS